MADIGLDYGNYVVYVDESGDHSLESINPRYPLFVLAFCIFEKYHYVQKVIPALSELKFNIFGHELIILHEHEIRKKTGAFSKLNFELREHLILSLSNLMTEIEMSVIPIVIDKRKLNLSGPDPTHIYHLAMQIGLEKLYHFLHERNQQMRLTHIVFEARGRCEDQALELEFLRICTRKQKLPFEIVIADKKTNSVGLQIADLVARPIGLSILHPEQPNRAFAILEKKLHQEETLFASPLKSERPQGSP